MKIFYLTCSFIALAISFTSAQDDLEESLKALEKKDQTIQIVTAAFKSTHVINLQSLERKAEGDLEFRIAHRFGPLNGGAYQLLGLDQATMRLSLEYGVNRLLTVGLGRSTYEKTIDVYGKLSVVQQQTGTKNIPVSLLYYVNIAANGLKWENTDRENYFSSRLSYVHQLILGSKLSQRFSVQISPTIIHKNLLPSTSDQSAVGFLGKNNTYAVGFAGRAKLTKRMAITAEYIYRFPPQDRNSPTFKDYYDSFSIGFDIETGGHVFQFNLSNSSAMFDRAFITESTQQWKNMGVHLGFNITRDFTIKKNKR